MKLMDLRPGAVSRAWLIAGTLLGPRRIIKLLLYCMAASSMSSTGDSILQLRRTMAAHVEPMSYVFVY